MQQKQQKTQLQKSKELSKEQHSQLFSLLPSVKNDSDNSQLSSFGTISKKVFQHFAEYKYKQKSTRSDSLTLRVSTSLRDIH
jgi:hypothetical protein